MSVIGCEWRVTPTPAIRGRAGEVSATRGHGGTVDGQGGGWRRRGARRRRPVRSRSERGSAACPRTCRRAVALVAVLRAAFEATADGRPPAGDETAAALR